MMPYILRRLAYLVPTLLGVAVLVFSMMHLAGGDPARIMLGERARPEALAALRQELGLDDPLILQFGRHLARLLQGDLGRSIKTRTPVLDEVIARFPATFELALAAMLFATPIGIVAGTLAARKRGGWLDALTMTGSLCGISVPIFWLGLILILLFALGLPELILALNRATGLELPLWRLPVSGRIPYDAAPTRVTGLMIVDALLEGNSRALTEAARHLVLPALTLGTIPLAVIARMTRSEMLSALSEDYIRTARAKGLSERRVVYLHGLRNAFIPVVTVLGLQFGALLGGAILTETVFAWPGVGRWLVSAVMARDFPAAQGGTLLVATTFVLINLAVDILYGVIDPRIRLGGRA